MGKRDDSPIYLIDGSSYLYRAFFSTPREFTSSKGVPTRAVYVITSMLLKILKEKDPEFIAVTWDAKGPTFRHKLYRDYKANRPPMPEDLSTQVPYVRRLVDALGMKQLEVEGYEADDIIATLAKGFGEKSGKKVVIVSGDKDLLQLISDNVVLWDPMKDEEIDMKVFSERYGIRPEQFNDVLSLAGDSADNIPGIPGVGPKTAIKLISEFHSVDNLVKGLDRLKKGKLKERLLKGAKELSLWKRLTTLDSETPVDLDFDSYRRKKIDEKRLLELFKELDFESFIPMVSSQKVLSHDDYKLIQQEEQLVEWLEENRGAAQLVIDTETTSRKPMEAALVGVSLCFAPPEAVYIAVGHDTDEPQVGLDILKRHLLPLLKDRSLEKIGQNIKYDLIVLRRHGLGIENITGDTMVASYLLDPTRRRHNLDEIARDSLGHRMISYKEVTKGLARSQNFSHVPLDRAMEYACEDVHVTFEVKEKFHEELKKKGLWHLYFRVEIPLISVLAQMEINGILIDRPALVELREEFTARLEELREKIFELAGHEFNINSPKQLAEVLFEELNLPQLKKTKKKTGYSTDVEVLKSLAKIHPLPERLLEYRNLSKLESTYVDGLEREVNPETGRIHTSFNQTVTATGRLSSSEPNLQNIPVRTEEGRRIRALFIAGPGNCLVSADYSQIDLRVLAHYSGDDNLVKAFRAGEDIHRRTAAQIFDVEPEFVTLEMRRVAKTVNFGIIYGMSAYGLARELGIGRKEAKTFIDTYFERYPGVRRFMIQIVERARRQGFVETILGRRRYLKEIKSRNRIIRQFAERTAINTPIQGSAADIIKLAMLQVAQRFQEQEPDAMMLLQVHDELVVECPESRIQPVAACLKQTMEDVVDLLVPLKVVAGWGKKWDEIK